MRLLMDIIKKLTKRNTKFLNKEKFMEWFFTQSYHAWILKNDHYFQAFQSIINTLEIKTIENLWQEREIAFIKAEGNLSCAIDAPKHLKFILCFPELLQFLRSDASELGKSIIFHELGHIFHKHNQKNTDQLKAQFEADEFAYFHGYGEQIIDVIDDYRHLEDNRKRIINIQKMLINDKRSQNIVI